MAYTIAPAVRALLDQANALWPNRSRISDGTIGDQAHSSRTSDHNPDGRGIVHAADLTHDPAHGCDNNTNSTTGLTHPAFKYRIWSRRILNPAVAPYWRSYTGSNPHDHHMHTSVNSGPTENDTSPWFDGAGSEITVAEADRIIETIGRYEQDTRRLLIDLMERMARAAREVEGRRTRRIIAAIEAMAQGRTAKVAEELRGLVSVEAADPAQVTADWMAELDQLNEAQDGGHDHP